MISERWQVRCVELTGVETLSRRLVDSLVTRAEALFGADVMQRVLEAEDYSADPIAKGAARALTYGLYTGLLPDLLGEDVQPGKAPRDCGADEELDYFEAAVWRVIQAHPPALSGGYFGYWHYPPEDAP